jgi:thiol:disulfide interchange protein DsbD
MTVRSCLALMLVNVVVSATPLSAEDWPQGNARVELVASSDRAGASHPTLVGVRFDIKPGWHIYWRNPGGAGMATEIGWRLPAGVTAGDVLWPVPISFLQSGEIPGYGYEDEVVLAAELGGARLADDDVVGASVSWLACRDVCVLGSATVEARWSEVAGDPVFSHWRSMLPTGWDDDDAPFSVTATGGLNTGTLSLWLKWRQLPESVEWFPDFPEGLVVEDVTIRTRGGLSRIDASIRRMAGSEGDFDTLPSVVAITDKHGKRRGWNLSVELTDDNP